MDEYLKFSLTLKVHRTADRFLIKNSVAKKLIKNSNKKHYYAEVPCKEIKLRCDGYLPLLTYSSSYVRRSVFVKDGKLTFVPKHLDLT